MSILTNTEFPNMLGVKPHCTSRPATSTAAYATCWWRPAPICHSKTPTARRRWSMRSMRTTTIWRRTLKVSLISDFLKTFIWILLFLILKVKKSFCTWNPVLTIDELDVYSYYQKTKTNSTRTTPKRSVYIVLTLIPNLYTPNEKRYNFISCMCVCVFIPAF